jgi:hypothetical protein
MLRVMAAKLTRFTQITEIPEYLVAESCATCQFHS